MDGGDLVTMSYVTRVLRAHGIWSSTQGSIGWGTSVRTSERAEAERWLRQEAGLRGYVTWLPSASRDSIPPPTRREVRIDADVASALRVHASDTIVGRILRSEDLRRYLRGSTTAKVDGVSWISRPLVNEALKPTTAIVGTVDLRSVTSQFPHATTCTVVLEEH